MRALKEHLLDGSLQQADFDRRYEYAGKARNLTALENLFHDLGGFADESREWRIELKRRGRLLHALDVVLIVVFLAFFLVFSFFLDVSWSWAILPAIVVVPILARWIVPIGKDAEISYENYAYSIIG